MIMHRHRTHQIEDMGPRANKTRSQTTMLSSSRNIVVDCSWGRLLFGQTFEDPEDLIACLREEVPNHRDIALYYKDPHVVIARDPQSFFLDPSHTYRLQLQDVDWCYEPPHGFQIRGVESMSDAIAIQGLHERQHMIPPDADFIWFHRHSPVLNYRVAECSTTGKIIGAVLGIDHVSAFQDPEQGTSLWTLVVDSKAHLPGVGKSLVKALIEQFRKQSRQCLDLSVLHDNNAAIALYEKLGFQRIPIFALKRKNTYNEPLYVGSAPEDGLNPYASIIVKEARRRGIQVDVIDQPSNYFQLSFGGRSITCRESLTELTSAVAMSRCDDKSVTRRLLVGAGLSMPDQITTENNAHNQSFLEKYGRVVVKPARGEQGAGISVDIRTVDEMNQAIAAAQRVSHTVLLEQLVHGLDLRIVVIDYKVVAAAVRTPPTIYGNGVHTVRELIEKHSRRRAAATGGESHIPIDAEAERCIRDAGYDFSSCLPEGEKLTVRKTANLHTGGTIEDVTMQLGSKLAEAAISAAKTLQIPVVGLDFIVPSLHGRDYFIIEANERPGLANHEPQPTAERFIDLLFPLTSAGD